MDKCWCLMRKWGYNGGMKWDERYAGAEYHFGTQPNQFLVECAAHLKPGKVLSLGEGEGRNAIYLAKRGYEVTAVDFSAVGNAKAQKLAQLNAVTLTTITADLNDYVIEPGAWDLIMCFFCHMPQDEREPLHRRVAAGLKRGGAYVYEVFSPRQLDFNSGGPTTLENLVSLAQARRELAGLELRIGREVVRRREENDPESEAMAVLQVLGLKR